MTGETIDTRMPAERVNDAYERLSELVTKHGPKHLVRGMPSYLAHEAMLACIEHLIGCVEFYAQKDRYMPPLAGYYGNSDVENYSILRDKGERARLALEGKKP